jgi:hypothetical protein
VKVVQTPFSRDVNLSSRQVKDGAERIAEIACHFRLCQESKAIVCIARESRLSLELKAEVLPELQMITYHAEFLFFYGCSFVSHQGNFVAMIVGNTSITFTACSMLFAVCNTLCRNSTVSQNLSYIIS